MSAGVHVHASFRDITIKIPDSGCNQGCEWRHAPEAWAEIWEKSVSWVPASEEEGWLSLARRGLAAGAYVVWGRWKSQVYLSPYVEKPFNSKVIKSFVPELRSRKCFLCFGIPILSICSLWTFYVHFTYTCMAMLQVYLGHSWFLYLSRSFTNLYVIENTPSLLGIVPEIRLGCPGL